MKTIGTCKECKWMGKAQSKHFSNECAHPENRQGEESISGANPSENLGGRCFISPGPDFGCIHWESKFPANPNYPTLTAQDLEIAVGV